METETPSERITEKLWAGTLPSQRVGDEAAGYKPNINYYPFFLFEHHARGKEKNFPDFVFIEPRYVGFAPNDDHPPHDPFNGQRLIAKVYTIPSTRGAAPVRASNAMAATLSSRRRSMNTNSR
jgi:hypothetical protein